MNPQINLYILTISILLFSVSCQNKTKEIFNDSSSFKILEIQEFPSEINECSGLVNLGNHQVIAMNDGGAGPHLHYFNHQDPLTLIEKKTINSLENKDWEAITSNGDELVIGDFGNNLGNRKDLTIHHLDLDSLYLKRSVAFTYPDQHRFDVKQHNFDCESLVIHNDRYHLFSKNRGNNKSYLYTSEIDDVDFQKRDSIIVPGLVTDATYHSESDQFILLCAKLHHSFWTTFLYQIQIDANFKIDSVSVFELGINEQLESIAPYEDNKFYLGSETEMIKGGKFRVIEILNL